MLVGYARTSSLAQVAGLEAQERELHAAGCNKIFREQVSSVAQRDQLEQALDYVREGDTLMVTKLDRLARSVGDLLAIVARLEVEEGQPAGSGHVRHRGARYQHSDGSSDDGSHWRGRSGRA